MDIPASLRQGHGGGFGVGVEDNYQLILLAVCILRDVEAQHIEIEIRKLGDLLADLLGGGHPQSRMLPAEGDETGVVVHHILIHGIGEGVPLDGVDGIGGFVGIVVKAALGQGLGAEHLFTRLEEGGALARHDDGGGQIVHADPLFQSPVLGGHGQPVEKAQTIVAGHIVDHLAGILSPGGMSQEGILHIGGKAARTGGVAGLAGVGVGAPDRIADHVGEVGHAGRLFGIGLGGQNHILLGDLGAHVPALGVEDHVGMGLVDLLDDLVDGLHVDQAQQVKAEAVQMVLVRPILDGIDNVLADHGPLGGGVVAADGAVGVVALLVDAAEIAGDDVVEAEALRVIDMVVDHIQNDADSGLMKPLDHLLELLHTDLAVVGVRRVAALRDIVVDGIVAPVEARLGVHLVHGGIVIAGQQVDVGDAQILDVVQPRGDAVRIGGAGLEQAQELAGLGDAGAGIGAQVPDMELVDDRIGDLAGGVGDLVILPAHGVCRIQIEDHGPLAVDAGGPGVGITGLPDFTIDLNTVGIVGAVQIALNHCNPGTIDICSHGNGAQHDIQAGLSAVVVEHDSNSVSRWSPDTEGGLLRGPGGTQIIARIGILILEIRGGIPDGHPHFPAVFAVGQGIGGGDIDGLGGDDGVDVLLTRDDLGDGHCAIGTREGEGGGVADRAGHGGPQAQSLGIGGVPDAHILIGKGHGDHAQDEEHCQRKRQHPRQKSSHNALSLFNFGRKCLDTSIIL